MQNILADRCILDGKMLVWDTSNNRFADFGSNQEIAKAAREGLDSDRQLCCILWVILIFQKVVYAFSKSGSTISSRDEGIVLKDLNSKWELSDWSTKWLKWKPDYVRTSSDLDVLIIGCRGGEVAQFLVGLGEGSGPNTYPRRFISFCRVGTGLSDDELDALVTKLKPYFRKNEYPKKTPSYYEVTNCSKERPDVWIESPKKSIILSITRDIQTIRSEVFAAPYSLRFPRIDRKKNSAKPSSVIRVDVWVKAHTKANGELSNEEVAKNLAQSVSEVRSIADDEVLQTQMSTPQTQCKRKTKDTNCKLLSWKGSKVVVAHAQWVTEDPKCMLHNQILGPNVCKIVVTNVVNPSFLLWMATGDATTIGSALKSFIAWPKKYVVMKDD
ncbi:hypothetical protein GIB67_039846 [Kingdonia uniflora]|uniref:ATP-dependent DNA ligase family profile domain-containing protein n=1 Tax=Kingdonia uniflora TaxID=39325 RepID=A0A7J7P387_9MAGN|nr:hypothetical protein GIB67_039846 [Kingdonia uniflora]